MTIGGALLLALTAVLASALVGRWAPRLWLGLTLVAAAAGLVAAGVMLSTGTTWLWRSPEFLLAVPVTFRLDGVSALFLLLLCVVAAAASVYARQYWTDQDHPRSAPSGRVWWSLLLLSMALILVSSSGLYYLVAWEGMTISAYFLVTLARNNAEARSAGWLFLAVSHASVLALFAFFAALASHTGSWELGPMLDQASLAPLFWLVLFGHGIKAGMYPLHIWLPSAHSNAPSHVSAILSGVSIKVGIYGLVRFSGWLPLPEAAGWTVVGLGIASAVLGVAFALGQHDLKRLLAYHSVENIGIILIGLGFAMISLPSGQVSWGVLALAGGLLHVWNHGLFKSLLFLGAGSVLHATGTREMSRLGGLWRTMPWTTGLFGLGAVAICGLPPLNGFVSELLLYLGLFDAAMSRTQSMWVAIPAAVLLGVTGALAVACFVKVCGVVFLGSARSAAAAHAHECGWAMRGAMVVLALACVAIGIAPVLFWPGIAAAVGAWRPTATVLASPLPLLSLGWAHLVVATGAIGAAVWLRRRVRRLPGHRSPTWGCGFAAPTARMQYTAGSFAGILVGWFDFILRPERHDQRPLDVFPAAARLVEHTPETVLKYLVEPVSSLVLRGAAAARALQHGGVQAYLVELLFGMVGLAMVVFAMGLP